MNTTTCRLRQTKQFYVTRFTICRKNPKNPFLVYNRLARPPKITKRTGQNAFQMTTTYCRKQKKHPPQKNTKTTEMFLFWSPFCRKMPSFCRKIIFCFSHQKNHITKIVPIALETELRKEKNA